jgi:hypothetical protein
VFRKEREGRETCFFFFFYVRRHRRRRRKPFWADVTWSLNSPLCSAAWCCCVCVYIGRWVWVCTPFRSGEIFPFFFLSLCVRENVRAGALTANGKHTDIQ